MSVMCVLAFLAFLRNGKLTIFTKVHAILTNVTQLDRLGDNQCRVQALQLPLDNYKHKANEPPFIIFIYPEKICCPGKLLLDFISVRGSAQGSLFLLAGWEAYQSSVSRRKTEGRSYVL